MIKSALSAGVRHLVGQVLDLIAQTQDMPQINIAVEGPRLTLVADLGVDVGRKRRSMAQPGRDAEDTGGSGVTPEAVLASLEKHPSGLNLGKIAKRCGISRKMLVKPIVDSLVKAGQLERASGGKVRIPGRVRRGRKPGRKRQVAGGVRLAGAETSTASTVARARPTPKQTTPTPSKDGSIRAAKAAKVRPTAPVSKGTPRKTRRPVKSDKEAPAKTQAAKAPTPKQPSAPVTKASHRPRPEARQRTTPVLPSSEDASVPDAPETIAPDEVYQAAPATETTATNPPEVSTE